MSPFSDKADVQRQPKLPDQVAALLQEMILKKQLKPGDKLPAERELSEHFGVSRTVIREAVRALTARGLLEVHTGSGTLVSQVSAQSITDALVMMLQVNQQATLENIREMRQLLEVEIAGLAAQRRSQTDVEQAAALIQRAADHLDDVDIFVETDVGFHMALANASQNILFTIMLDSVNGIMVGVRRLGASLPQTPVRALAHHKAILDRVQAQDVVGARAAMQSHLAEAQATQTEALSQHEANPPQVNLTGSNSNESV